MWLDTNAVKIHSMWDGNLEKKIDGVLEKFFELLWVKFPFVCKIHLPNIKSANKKNYKYSGKPQLF